MTNTYDSHGRRVRKQVSVGGTPTKDIRFFYDHWNLLFEHDLLASSDTQHYVWGLDLSQSLQGAGGVGGLLYTQSATNAHAATFDANGNVSEYTALSDGTITAHLEFDAFGRKTTQSGTPPCAFGFSTKYHDPETGLVYYGFRSYSPDLGRWVNRDPIGERGGINLLNFVENRSSNSIDLFGLAMCWPKASCLAVVAAVATKGAAGCTILCAWMTGIVGTPACIPTCVAAAAAGFVGLSAMCDHYFDCPNDKCKEGHLRKTITGTHLASAIYENTLTLERRSCSFLYTDYTADKCTKTGCWPFRRYIYKYFENGFDITSDCPGPPWVMRILDLGPGTK